MKYLKLYEKKWNKNKLDSFLFDKEEICNLIKEFIIEEYPNYCEDIYSVISFRLTNNDSVLYTSSGNVSNVKNNPKMMLVEMLIKPMKSGITNDTFLITDLDKLYSFIEEPDLYKSTKKYNL